MSLYGRNIIDRVKRAISHRLTLPVPPYQSPAYWEKVYSQLDENDVFEWGDVYFESQLKSFTFKKNQEYTNEIRQCYGDKVKIRYGSVGDNDDDDEGTMEFHRALFDENHADIPMRAHKKRTVKQKNSAVGNNDVTSSVVVLGCGNSRLGEDILHYYLERNSSNSDSDSNLIGDDKHQSQPQLWSKLQVIQCDISTHVVNSMTKRYQKYIDKNLMTIIQDDATQFTLMNDESVDGVVDKGLVDALYCAEQGDMVQQIMGSVHRTLKPGRVFLFFSFSRPEHLLRYTVPQRPNHNSVTDNKGKGKGTSKQKANSKANSKGVTAKWSAVDILELNEIFLYRFVKAIVSHPTKSDKLKRKRMPAAKSMERHQRTK